jgi:hypothetical protein
VRTRLRRLWFERLRGKDASLKPPLLIVAKWPSGGEAIWHCGVGTGKFPLSGREKSLRGNERAGTMVLTLG